MTVDLREGLNAAHEALRNLRFRRAACLHEAAHGIYWTRAGAAVLAYHGPQPNSLGVAIACVEFRLPDDPSRPIRLIAKALCSGTVAVRQLMDDVPKAGSAVGDEHDFKDFWTKYASHLNSTEVLYEWRAAQREVEQDLRNPSFRRELWAEAHNVERVVQKEVENGLSKILNKTILK